MKLFTRFAVIALLVLVVSAAPSVAQESPLWSAGRRGGDLLVIGAVFRLPGRRAALH